MDKKTHKIHENLNTTKITNHMVLLFLVAVKPSNVYLTYYFLQLAIAI